MRLASVLFSLLLFGLLAGVALADPNAPAEEKEWQLYVDPTRAIIPEVEPNNTCPGQTVACGDVVDPATIATSTDVDWYTVYNVIGGTILTFATDNGSNCGAPYLTDSYIELYYNCGTTRVAYDDDSGPGYYSLLTYTVPAGSPGNYSLKVRGYSASYTGCYKLSITCAGPPPNDRCDGAFPWQRCSSGTVNGTTVGAVNDYSPQPPSPGCTGYPATGGDVTYRLDLQRGDVVTVTYTTPNHDGSIYMVTDCANPGATCVIGDDDPEPETWTYTALTAGTYYVIADGYSASGPFTLDWSITCPSPGACCNLATGACYYILQTDCVPPMEWYGGPCGPNNEPCPQPPPLGACCFEDGHCELLTQAQCDAAPGHIAWLGQGTVCEPVNPCPQPGACCDLATGACYFVLEQFCAPPLVWFGGPCLPDNPCPQRGACCDLATGACYYILQTDCVPPMEWYGGPCGPNNEPCPQPPPLGACCFLDGTCSVLTEEQCTVAGGFLWIVDEDCVDDCPPVPTEKTTWGKVKATYR